MHYVIGDVHGCYDEMMQLIHKIERKDEEAQFIFVGDLVDRGPKVWQTLEWAMEHITKDGKYQSVLGNHEALILDWYSEFTAWWNKRDLESDAQMEPMPETSYDFSRWMDAMNMLTPKNLEPIIDFFRSLPYFKKLDIQSAYGKSVTFRIVHAWYNYNLEEDSDEQKQCNLWERNYWGNYANDEIIVHGHTPTFDRDYLLRGAYEDAPGMICYRPRAINVDGGCCFQNGSYDCPYMLGAICLETLEEIYPYTLEERLFRLIEAGVHNRSWEKEVIEEYCKVCLEEYHTLHVKKVRARRDDMLKQMGK